MTLVACVDIGSTATKGSLVDTDDRALLATAAVPTSAPDVLDGVDAVLDRLARHGSPDEVRACSSAGGGLRLAVVGYERSVTAEAGRRAALSAGARVVHVLAGRLDAADVRALRASRPDVALLCGGTDGGDGEVLLANARALGRSRRRVPVVVAGNADVRDEAVALLRSTAAPVVAVANVLPEIGRLEVEPARAAVRELFLSHVIGGKGLTRRPARLRSLVRAATPDAVLAAVEVLASAAGGDVLVVDVGGATTDVCSVVDGTAGDGGPEAGADVAGDAQALRTVEGDLGVRSSARALLEAAAAERLALQLDPGDLRTAAEVLAREPWRVPTSSHERAVDAELARLAVTVAVRRHARPRRDLRRVRLVVGSGGVLRHADTARRTVVLAATTADPEGAWPVPEHAAVAVDVPYVLGAAGLLAPDLPDVALQLLTDVLVSRPTRRPPRSRPLRGSRAGVPG